MDVNYLDIEFDHSVTFERDKLIFAVGRERASGCIRVFRINDATGTVHTLASHRWAEIGECDGDAIINKLTEAWSRRIPVYTVEG